MPSHRSLVFMLCFVFLVSSRFVYGGSESRGYSMNQPVTGKGWTITVVSAKNAGAEIMERCNLDTVTLKPSNPESYLLRLKVNLKSLDKESVGGRYIVDALVRDSKGNKYPCSAVGVSGCYVDFRKGIKEAVAYPMNSEVTVDYIFSIPNQIKIVDFIWNGTSPALLKVE